MISPTIGRVLWFYPRGVADLEEKTQPSPALVCFVHSDKLVNLAGFRPSGRPFQAEFTTLVQEGEDPPAIGPFATWMPYQIGADKAAKEKAK